ncbi:MAG TPA: DUF4129 domain-containing protein [Terracidiphilus sp.]|jgi:hypothetical protein
MSTAQTRARTWIVFLLALAALAADAQNSPQQPSQANGRWHDISIDEYRQHLVALSALVDSCAKARNVKGCDPTLIGQDDRVPIVVGSQTENRLVRYGWLRVLFAKAEEPDEKTAPAVKPSSGIKAGSNQIQPTTSDFLTDAKVRLENDVAQSHAPEAPIPDHAAERAAMEQVLAGPDFRNLKRQSVTDSAWEKLGNWLNRLLASAGNLRSHSKWVGRTIVWGFIFGVCVVLVYSLVRLERRWRLRLTIDVDRPAPGAPSARDWQLWLEDARRAAASGLWREAIHFVYWAAISRLESRRLWPADRARTPREYLALVAPEDPRRPGLSELTSTFERFWYGGRLAGENDYQNAESLASTLMSGGSPAGSAPLSTAPEGGAR